MKSPKLERSRWVTAMTIVAVLFGLLTVVSGGSVLFNAEAQRLAGNYVPFVLWFSLLDTFSWLSFRMG